MATKGEKEGHLSRCRRDLIHWLPVTLISTLLLLAACQDKAAPTPPPPPPTYSPAWGTTPTAGLSANWEAYAEYFESIHLWRVPADRPPTAEDKASPVEVFTPGESQVGISIETTPDFPPGWELKFWLEKRGPGVDRVEVSLASLVTGPGAYDTVVGRPKDIGGYVLRFWLEDVLIANVTFEVR